MVRFVAIAPEDQAFPPFGVRAGYREHAVDPAAGLHAQADQIVERLGQIDRDLAADAVAHDRDGVGEGVPELLAEQGRAAGRLDAERVAQPVVFPHFRMFGQQPLPLVRRRRHDEAIHRVFVRFEADVLEQLGHAFPGDRLAFLPVRRMDDLLHARQDDRVEVATDFHECVTPAAAVLAVQIDDRVAGDPGAGEEVEYPRARLAAGCADAVLHQRDRLRKIEGIVDEQFLEHPGSVVGRRVLGVPPPRLGRGLHVHALHEVNADGRRSGISAVSLHAVFAGFAGHSFRAALPVLFDPLPVLFLHRPCDGFVLARPFQDPVFRTLLVPFHLRNTQGVVVADEDRVVQLRPVGPPVVRSRPKQVAPGVPSVFVGKGISPLLLLRLDERSGNGFLAAVEQGVFVGRRQLSDRRPADRRRADRGDAELLVEHVLQQGAQPPGLFVVDGAAQDAVILQERPGEPQTVVHQRQPRRVLVVVLVQDRRGRRVVRRVGVDALHLPPVPRLQQVQGLEVLAVDQQAVGLLVERAGVRKRRQQPVGEAAVEVPRVHHQVRVGREELRARRIAPAGAAVGQVAGDLVRGEQRDPFRALRGVEGDFGVERFRHAVQGDAPVGLQDELLLEPEPLLELLELRQEVDDLAADVADGPHARQGAVEPGGVALLQVVQVQHLGVQVQVERAAQEAAEVLVDEIVEAVLRRVTLHVLRQQRALAVGVGRGRRGQRNAPVGRRRGEDPFGRRLVDAALLRSAVPRPALPFAFRQRPVREADDQIVLLDGDGAPAAGEHEAAPPAVRLLDVVLLVVGRRDLEPDAPRTAAGVDGEDIGGVVLRRLDVVLVGVRPVELHFLAVVGEEVGGPATARIAALRDEVAVAVVAGEEVGEVVVDVGLGVRVLLHLGEPPVQLDDRGRSGRIGIEAQLPGCLARVFDLLLQPGPFRGGGQVELRLHLRQQVPVEERRDLGRLQVHDAVQAEVQIAAVETEHLAQQRLQPVELLRRSRSRGLAVGDRGRAGHGELHARTVPPAAFRYSVTTAVPLTLTISMLAPCPTTS